MEEGDRRRVAAVLAADADLEARPRRAALLDGHAHELADALDVERLERVGGQDPALDVGQQEAALGVVAASSRTSSASGRSCRS